MFVCPLQTANVADVPREDSFCCYDNQLGQGDGRQTKSVPQTQLLQPQRHSNLNIQTLQPRLRKSILQRYSYNYYLHCKCKEKRQQPFFFCLYSQWPTVKVQFLASVSHPTVPPLCSHLFTAVVVLALLLPLPMMLSYRLLTASAWIHSTPLHSTPLHSTTWGQWSHLSRWGTDLTASRPVHWPSPWLSVSINGWSPLEHEVRLRHCGNMLR